MRLHVKRLSSALVFVALSAALWAAPATAHAALAPEATLHASVVEIAGADRYETSVKTSQQIFKPGAIDTVVIASGEDWPDAICASPLAGVNHAPLLLTRPNALPSVVAAEISRLHPARAIVVGGRSAVSDAVMTRLASLVASGAPGVSRIGGADRYETSALIALEVCKTPGGRGGGGEFFVATGKDFPDALTVASAAFWQGEPILLTRPNEVPAPVRAAIPDVGFIAHIIGDRKAVGDAVVTQLLAIPNSQAPAVDRHGGIDRYDTAVIVDEWLSYGWSDVALATGERFPDALTAGVMQGATNCPVLLSRRSTLPLVTANILRNKARAVTRLRILGDTNALSANVRTAARNALSY